MARELTDLERELLDALRGVMRFALPITGHDVEDFSRARAAIVKAESAS